MLREAHELRHGAKVLVQIVELVDSRTCAAHQAVEAIQRAITPAIIREVQKCVVRIAARTRNYRRQSVLIWMHVIRGRHWNASVNMRQVDEWRRRAGWIQRTDLTFVEVDRARLEISSSSVGHRQ
jgi:hypothetical protein